MSKLTLNDLSNLQNESSAVALVNANSALIETALENTLSRDGTAPNQMLSDLDMNSFHIYNNPAPVNATHLVRLQDLEDAALAPLSLAGLIRIKISDNTNYYVATTGNDTTGTGAIGLPWRTIQKAIDYVCDNTVIDSDVIVTINVADGTYAESVRLRNYVGSWQHEVPNVKLKGNLSTPANCIVTGTLGASPFACFGLSTEWNVGGFKVVPADNTQPIFLLDWNAHFNLYGGWAFTAPTNAAVIQARYGSSLEILAGTAMSLTGNCAAFAVASQNSIVLSQGSPGASILTLVGTPAFSNAFTLCDANSLVDVGVTTYIGSATGSQFFTQGILSNMGFAGQSLGGSYPGSIAGTFTERLRGLGQFYVNASTGSDTLGIGTAAKPWASIPIAIAWIRTNADLNASYILNVADGTYTTGAGAASGLNLSIVGNTTTPSNVTWNVSGNCLEASQGASVSISGIKFISTGTALLAYNGGNITIAGKCEFGACGVAMEAQTSGVINISANYTVNGNQTVHYFTRYGGVIRNQAAITVTLSGTPAWANAMAVATTLGLIQTVAADVTYTGAATGVRYTANLNAVIDTVGGGANKLPGNSAGSVATGGVYA